VTSPARRAAYDLLHEVGGGDAYANLAMPAIISAHRLDPRDAGLATELAFTTLRWRGLLDAVLARCVDRPLDRLDPQTHDVLRLGAAQLLLMRVPRHAAVSESVSLARDVRGEGASRLVNAVLRRVAGRDLEAWRQEVVAGVDDPVERRSLLWSHPRWIITALMESMPDPERVDELLAVDNAAPAVTLVARPGRCEVEELLEAAPGSRRGRWSPHAVVMGGGAPGALAAVREGRAGVQDEGSQLVALALADVAIDGPDESWVDLCAGPGGKAALLAGLAGQRGAQLTAVEPALHRADLVRSTCAGLPVDVVVADGRTAPLTGFDRVLVDAPCTGLGVIRRRPEARWRRTPADVGALARLQRELLGAGLRAARPGGLVLYSTCSPHLAETSLVVADVLRDHPGVERVPLALAPGDAAAEDARLWPHLHGTDGMYAAALRVPDAPR